MANFYKVLGQVDATGGSEDVLYTVPEWTQVKAVSFVACNRGPSARSFRLRVKVNGEADDDKQFVYYDKEVKADESFVATVEIMLGPMDVVAVYSSNADMSFGLFGLESAVGRG